MYTEGLRIACFYVGSAAFIVFRIHLCQSFRVNNPKEKPLQRNGCKFCTCIYYEPHDNHLGDPGVDGRIILIWIIRKWDVGYGPDRSTPGQGQEAGTCAYGNEPSGSIKCREFLD
jgi:hypothetical protein